MSESIELTGTDLKKLQMVELDLIKEVDRICKKNNIRYSLYAGTLLGAVRHNGFIPWDDDADVVFLADDYERFFEACKKDLNSEKYFLQDYRTDEYYRWGYAKLRRNDSAFIRTGQEHMKHHTGICIDIFPLFNVPDNAVQRKIYYTLFFLIRKTLYSEVGKKNEKNKILKVLYTLLSKIPKNAVFCFAQKIIYKNESTNVDLMYIPNSPRCKYGIPKRCLVNSIKLKFEDSCFCAMEGFDEVLKMAYGDYMDLPPEEDRVSHNPASKIVFPNENTNLC